MTEPARPRGRPFDDNSELPLPFKSGKRWTWRRPDVENVRRVFEGRPTKPVKASASDELVTVAQLAKELRVSVRTVMRRIEKARATMAEASAGK